MPATPSPHDPDEQPASCPEFPDVTLPARGSAPRLPGARRVLLARHGRDPSTDSADRTVHLFPLPLPCDSSEEQAPALRLTREIDVAAALREPPAGASPAHF